MLSASRNLRWWTMKPRCAGGGKEGSARSPPSSIAPRELLAGAENGGNLSRNRARSRYIVRSELMSDLHFAIVNSAADCKKERKKMLPITFYARARNPNISRIIYKRQIDSPA